MQSCVPHSRMSQKTNAVRNGLQLVTLNRRSPTTRPVADALLRCPTLSAQMSPRLALSLSLSRGVPPLLLEPKATRDGVDPEVVPDSSAPLASGRGPPAVLHRLSTCRRARSRVYRGGILSHPHATAPPGCRSASAPPRYSPVGSGDVVTPGMVRLPRHMRPRRRKVGPCDGKAGCCSEVRGAFGAHEVACKRASLCQVMPERRECHQSGSSVVGS